MIFCDIVKLKCQQGEKKCCTMNMQQKKSKLLNKFRINVEQENTNLSKFLPSYIFRQRGKTNENKCAVMQEVGAFGAFTCITIYLYHRL